MTLWLYLHFPSLQLDALYQRSSEQAQPLIIVHEQNKEVIQLNRAAINDGVKLGMGLGAASFLSRDLQVKAHNEKVERKVLMRIAHWLYSVTADISVFPPNGLLLKVSSMLTLHKNLHSYWQQLSEHLNELGLQYYYATGYSPYAARILAKQALNQISDDKAWLLAQVKNQSLKQADLVPNVISNLEKVGVKKLADLLSLSLPELAKRFNIDVVNYIGRLTGHLQHPINFHIPPERFEQYLELFFEVSNIDYIEKPILKLYKLLEKYLRKKDQLASELQIVFHQKDADDLDVSVVAAEGEYKADAWLKLTQLTLESIKLAAPVVGLTLITKRLMSKYAQRQDLFQGSQGNLSSEELTSVLIAKLGNDRVRGIKLIEDARPEMANQLCSPFTKSNHQAPSGKLRPSILLPVPMQLQEKVTLIPSPERIVTGWWDGNEAIRDYFVGRSHDGRWLWVFRDNQKRWFIHGVFS